MKKWKKSQVSKGENEVNITEKLMNIQLELKAPKNQYNSFGKYKYRSCEDILEGLKPLLKEYKVALTIEDKIVQIGERYYVEATATLNDIEKAENIKVTAYAREDESKKGMDLSQVTGSTSSYARKYALNGLFAIDDTKDSDFSNTHGNDKKTETKKIDATKVTALKNLAAVKNSNVADIEKYYKMKVEDMDIVTWTKAINALKKK